MDLGALAIGYALGAASGWAIKVAVDLRARKNVQSPEASATGHSVSQAGNTAGGHIAGGDIKTDR